VNGNCCEQKEIDAIIKGCAVPLMGQGKAGKDVLLLGSQQV